MSDFSRSIQACRDAFGEFDRSLTNALARRQKTKIRIAIQVNRGRVQNTQVSSTSDFSPDDFDRHTESPAEHVVKAKTRVAQHFAELERDVAESIESRRIGWLRLSLSVEDGQVVDGNKNPSFDFKP